MTNTTNTIKNTKRISLILCSLTLSLLASCATSSMTLKEASEDTLKTSFLLNYELIDEKGDEKKKDCVVSFTHLDTKSTYQAILLHDKKSTRVEVPAGSYTFDKLSCDNRGNWNLDNFGAKTITATPNKVNYLGRFTFKVSRQGNVDELLVHKGNREHTVSALRQSAEKMSPAFYNALVSAYTKKPIDSQFLLHKKDYRPKTLSHVTGHKALSSFMNFDSCETEEFKSNPAPLGMLSLHAVYEGDRLRKLDMLADRSTFSRTYISCVKQILEDFKPGTSNHVEYEVNR